MADAHVVFLASLGVIAVGYAIKRSGIVSVSEGNVLARIVMNVTLPALILHTLPGAELSLELLALPLFAILESLLVWLLAWLMLRREAPRRAGILIMCSLGFNNGLFAFPIVEGIWGLDAVKLLAIFDVGNALVLLGLNYAIAGYYSAKAAGPAVPHGATEDATEAAAKAAPQTAAQTAGQGAPGAAVADAAAVAAVLKSLATSIPLIAFALGLVLNVSGAVLPAALDRVIGILAEANSGLVLLVLGIYQSFHPRDWDGKALAKVFLLRYGVGIVTGLALFFTLPMAELTRQVLLVAFVLPVGMSVIPFSVRFGLNTKIATTLVNTTILVSFVLMWLIVSLV